MLSPAVSALGAVAQGDQSDRQAGSDAKYGLLKPASNLLTRLQMGHQTGRDGRLLPFRLADPFIHSPKHDSAIYKKNGALRRRSLTSFVLI
jgi:hypothetical protein